MLKQAYEVYSNGFIKEIFVVNVDENGKLINDSRKHLIIVDPQQGLFKAKWTGFKWIEGATQEEIDELTKVEPSPPTEIELLKQRLEGMESALVDLILGGM